jgi:hypothetical protein
MNSLIFISAKADDYQHAASLYRFLKSAGLSVFFSHESLPELASSDYRKQIDDALDRAEHMIVVTSSRANVDSPWVEAEWGLFINEKRSGRKHGNLITVIVGNITAGELPATLRYYEVIPFSPALFPKILRYVSPKHDTAIRAGADPADVSPQFANSISTVKPESEVEAEVTGDAEDDHNLTGGSASVPKIDRDSAKKHPGPVIDGLATASLILGLIPCLWIPSLMAIIFGLISLSRIKASRGAYTGRGRAQAGIALGIFFLIMNILAVVVSLRR